jgi:hypothetical protein
VKRALLIAIALIGCSPAPPSTCADDLSGIWSAGDGRRYHAVDRAGAVEVFALDDSRGDLDRPMPGATRSASYARLERLSKQRGLAGHGQQFRSDASRVCRVRWPITATCDGALELQLSEPGAVSFADCSQAPAGPERALVLTRID